MSYETRAYDRANDDGFPSDPVVVLVATGIHDVSRFVNLLAGSRISLCEHGELAHQIRRQVKENDGGRAALELLAAHGGPDLLAIPDNELAGEVKRLAGEVKQQRFLTEKLARRFADHADCDMHPLRTADPACAHCGDRSTYLAYLDAGGKDFRPDNSGPGVDVFEFMARGKGQEGGATS